LDNCNYNKNYTPHQSVLHVSDLGKEESVC